MPVLGTGAKSLVEVVREAVRRQEVENIVNGALGTTERGVETAHAIKIVRGNQERRDSCKSLPLTLLFFICYVNSVMSHMSTYDSHRQQSAIRNIVEGTNFDHGHKNIYDINDFWDWWTWLDESFVPVFLQQKVASTGAPIPPEEWGRVMNYHRLLGGVLFEQVRTTAVPCPETAEWLDLTCFAAEEFSDEPFGDQPAFQPSGRRLDFSLVAEDEVGFGDPLAHAAARLPSFAPHNSQLLGRRLFKPGRDGKVVMKASAAAKGAPVFKVTFLESEPVAEHLAELARMKEGDWLDAQTFQVNVRFLLLNAEETSFYHYCALKFVFGRSGYITKRLEVQTFPVDPYHKWDVLITDVVFVGMITYTFVTEFKQAYWHMQQQTLTTDYLCDVWNVLDWATVFIGFTSISVWAWALVSTSSLSQLVKAYADENTQEAAATLHEAAASLYTGMMWLQILLSNYTLLIMFRFFKAFRAQPRLAIVTTTLYEASVDLFHFLCVLMTIFISYAMAGVFLFGRYSDDFMDFEFATMTCFRMMMGDFEWEEMAANHRVTAGIWFWSFMILVYLIMLNMLLAIVMDVYTGVKAAASGASTETLLTGLINVVRGLKNWKEVVSDTTIIEKLVALKRTPGGDRTDLPTLLKTIPEMTTEQGEELMAQFETSLADESEQMMSMSNAIKLIGWMKLAVDRIETKLSVTARKQKPRKYQRIIDAILRLQRSGQLREKVKALLDDQEGVAMGAELQSIPPAYRKVVQRVIQREMNVQFCILQEEMRQDLQHIRGDALSWFQDVDADLRGIRKEMQDCLGRVQQWAKGNIPEKPRSAHSANRHRNYADPSLPGQL